MPKIIYVPQSNSAKVSRDVEFQYEIAGLYTEGFSTCNILAVISNSKLMLVHLDTHILNSEAMLEQLQQEIEWVSEPREIVVVFKRDIGGGERVNKRLLAHLALEMPLVKILNKEIDNDTHGIYLSFDTQKASDIHSNIQKFTYGSRPTELIHHPQEQQFLAVQKIEQVIGQHARHIGAIRNKRICIFAKGWEPLSDAELKVDVSHPLTQREMLRFSKQDTYFDIVQKLIAVLNNSGFPYGGNGEDAMIFIAPHFEGYLNNYNQVLLFKRNLKHMISTEQNQPKSKGDNYYKLGIIKLLNKAGDIFDEAKQITDKYEAYAPETDVKGFVLNAYRSLAYQYQGRKYYCDLRQTYAQMIEEALRHYGDGLRNYKEKKHQRVASSFAEVIKLYTYYCVKSEPNLATTYYSYGQSLGKNGDYNAAVFFIKVALAFRENYTQPKPSQQELEKTRAILKEYQEKLRMQAHNLTLKEKIVDVKKGEKDESHQLYNQGMHCYRDSNYANALDFFQQELTKQQDTDIALHNLEAATLNFNIGSMYIKMQNSEASLPYLQDVFNLRMLLLGTNHEKTTKAKARLKTCQVMLSLTPQPLIFSGITTELNGCAVPPKSELATNRPTPDF